MSRALEDHGTAPDATAERWKPTGRTIFLVVLLIVLVFYTVLGFDLEWRTAAGRIGPGFFPRVVGVLAVAITLLALFNSLRKGATDAEEVFVDEEAGEADLGQHPLPLLAMVGACALLLLTFTWLGAIVSCALFMLVVLYFLNPGRHIVNIAVSLGLPIGVYLLFQSLLNAGLPDGILPRF